MSFKFSDCDFAHPRAESFFLLEFVYGDGGAPEINLFTVFRDYIQIILVMLLMTAGMVSVRVVMIVC